MTQTTWQIAIDWDRNGNFTDTYDDVSEYVISAQWFLGMRYAYRHMSDNSVLNLVLRNTDKRFSPENASGALNGNLNPLRPVRIQSTRDGVTRTHWTGWVETISPIPGANGDKRVHITATGGMQFLTLAETNVELQVNKRADDIIGDVMEEVIFPPALTESTFLDIPGSMELGQNTYMTDIDGTKVFDQGIMTFNIVGDNWVHDGGFSDRSKDTFNVQHAISDVVNAERGKFFFNRKGEAVFWNRHHLLKGYTPSTTFTDNMVGLQYGFAAGDYMKNDITVTCHPRTISASTDILLWELDGAVIRVNPNDQRKIFVKYEDDSENRIGAQEVTVENVEFERGNASVKLNAKASGAELVFTNNNDAEAIITRIELRGQKIVDSGHIDSNARDGISIGLYGRRTKRMSLPSMDDLDQAQYIADFELMRLSQPEGFVHNIKLLSHAHKGGNNHDNQLELTIGDFIRINESQTGHNRDYVIVGEFHVLDQGGQLYHTEWFVEPATQEDWFVIADTADPTPKSVLGDASLTPVTGDLIAY